MTPLSLINKYTLEQTKTIFFIEMIKKSFVLKIFVSILVLHAQQRNLPCSPGYILDGVHDFIHIPDTDRINLAPQIHNRTIEFWFKATNVSSRQMLYKEGANVNGISMYLENGRMYLGALKNNALNSSDRLFFRSESNAIQPNVWNHVAFVIERQSIYITQFKWYLNGQIQNDRQGFIIPSHSADIAIGRNKDGIRFPLNPNNWYASTISNSNSQTYTSQLTGLDTGFYPFQGNIALFRIWNRARTNLEIIANSSKYLTASVGTGLTAYQNGETIFYKATGAIIANSTAVANGYATTYTWTGAISNNWNNAGNWLNNRMPNPNRAQTVRVNSGGFSPEISSGTNALIGNLGMTNGTSITVKSGGTLEVYYYTTGANANVIVENGGAYKFNSCANSSSFKYNITRNSPNYSGAKFYSYWSSPVIESQSNPAILFPNNPNIYFFNAMITNADWELNNGANLKTGVGYAVRNENAGSYSVNFQGVINESEIAVPLGYNTNMQSTDPNNMWSSAGDNLVGNPYTAAIDWDLMVNDFQNTFYVEGTMYLWNQTVSLVGDNSIADYEQYNLTGGSSANITGKIASGQGFFVRATSSAASTGQPLRFKPIYQVSGNNSQFYKSENQYKKGRSWITLKHKNKFSSILIGFVKNATTNFDNLYDGPYDITNQKLGLYSFTKNGIKTTIQGMPLLNNEEIIQLGYVVNSSGEYTIALEEEYIKKGYNIYLEDTKEAKFINLKTDKYTFYLHQQEENNERFKLHYTQQTLSSSSFDVKTNMIAVFVDKLKNLHIYGLKNEEVKEVKIFNILGEEVYSLTKNEYENKEYFQLPKNMNLGIYIVKIYTLKNVVNKSILLSN